MSDVKQIREIKNNSERSIQGLLSKSNEFRYRDNNGPVKTGVLYSIYYTFNKSELYFTGVKETTNSREIVRIKNKTLYGKYSEIQTLTRDNYPQPQLASPTKADYRIGSIQRYFTQSANDSDKPVFEISKNDYDSQNSLFKYTQVRWVISGIKSEVERLNEDTLESLEQQYKGIRKTIFPLQLWKPSQDSIDDLKNKLKRLKK